MGDAFVDLDGKRRFQGRRKVRLGDVTTSGRLRLDALTRYTQDVSDDDTTDADLAPDPAWVVRRTSVEVSSPAVLAETLTFTTFCSGLGRRWAERHLSIRGDQAAAYEVSTLWICVDVTSGRPHTLTDGFLRIYGPSAGGRRVSARLSHPKPPPDATTWPWPLRSADFDTLGHVNNAAYWAVVEEVLGGRVGRGRLLASIEYAAGLDPEDQVTILDAPVEGEPGVDGPAEGGPAAGVGPRGQQGQRHQQGQRDLWWVTDAGVTAASALLEPAGS